MTSYLPLLLATLSWQSPTDTELRLNQIQVIGTHNSYHIAPYSTVKALIAEASGGQAEGLDYTHRPLAEQFSEFGIRQIELDVFADPEGGHFANPIARQRLIAEGQDPGPDPNVDGVLDTPGPKVLHVQDVDYLTTVPTLKAAIEEIEAWSEAHPAHVPIFILLELKAGAISGLTTPFSIDADFLDRVDEVVRSVLDDDQFLTPDDLRGEFKTLPEAITQQGWPKLDDVRGQVFFGLDNGGAVRDLYLDGHPALKDRVMFVDAGAVDHPAAAWFKRNNPNSSFDEFQYLLIQGFMIRTLADANTRQARSGDTTQREKALASGAQFISTDYPVPDRRFTDYQVQLPGGVVARPNPISGSKIVEGVDLEPVTAVTPK